VAIMEFFFKTLLTAGILSIEDDSNWIEYDVVKSLKYKDKLIKFITLMDDGFVVYYNDGTPNLFVNKEDFSSSDFE